VIHLELFARFLLISLIAFGGGQAALPLIEQIAVQDTRWLTPTTFGTAVAFGYLTPGPVLITATFVGQQVGGLLGALVTRLAQSRWLRAFGAGAGPAVIGLLGVTVLDVGRESLVSWPYVAVSAAVFVLTARTRTHPIALLAAGAVVGWLIGQSQL
jgi:chromate transporter